MCEPRLGQLPDRIGQLSQAPRLSVVGRARADTPLPLIASRSPEDRILGIEVAEDDCMGTGRNGPVKPQYRLDC